MQSSRYLLLSLQILLIFQLTYNTEYKKRARVAKRVQSNFLDDLRLPRDSLGRINFERERERETNAEQEGEFRRDGGETGEMERTGRETQRESARGSKRASNGRLRRGNPVRRGAIATICINAFLDHWPELLNIGSEYMQTSPLTCLMGNFRRNKPSAMSTRWPKSRVACVRKTKVERSIKKPIKHQSEMKKKKKRSSRLFISDCLSGVLEKAFPRNGKNATMRRR